MPIDPSNTLMFSSSAKDMISFEFRIVSAYINYVISFVLNNSFIRKLYELAPYMSRKDKVYQC